MFSTWPTTLGCVAAAILASPVLAGWTAAFPGVAGRDMSWWHWRPVSTARLLTVAAVAAGLAALAAGAAPVPAWWIFAAGGATLAVIDTEHHLLPARIVHPLTAILLGVLALSASVTGEPGRLVRAVLAATLVGVVWFLIAFTAPTALGLGDVRMAALTAGMLGWTGWSAVLAGQVATIGLALTTAGVIAVSGTGLTRTTQVPMGSAFVFGALLVASF